MIPRRLDRTLVGALASVLTKPNTLHLSTQQASSIGTWYLLGAVGGALRLPFDDRGMSVISADWGSLKRNLSQPG